MNSTLYKRVSAIEAATESRDEDFRLVRVVFCGHGEPTEIHSCTLLGDPEKFIRESGETEDAFMERVHQYARERRQPGQFVAVALTHGTAPVEEG